jgi:hypothetical protein
MATRGVDGWHRHPRRLPDPRAVRRPRDRALVTLGQHRQPPGGWRWRCWPDPTTRRALLPLPLSSVQSPAAPPWSIPGYRCHHPPEGRVVVCRRSRKKHHAPPARRVVAPSWCNSGPLAELVCHGRVGRAESRPTWGCSWIGTEPRNPPKHGQDGPGTRCHHPPGGRVVLCRWVGKKHHAPLTRRVVAPSWCNSGPLAELVCHGRVGRAMVVCHGRVGRAESRPTCGGSWIVTEPRNALKHGQDGRGTRCHHPPEGRVVLCRWCCEEQSAREEHHAPLARRVVAPSWFYPGAPG